MWAARCRKANRLPAIDIFQTASALFYNTCRQQPGVLQCPVGLAALCFDLLTFKFYLRYV